MGTMLEALKAINKNIDDEKDRFKIAKDYPDGYFNVKFYSTGSPYLDYKIKDIGGGFGQGRFSLIVGGEGSGKTSIACIAAAKMQRESGKYVVIYDCEQTIDQSYFDRFGLDQKLTIHRKTKELEEMLDSAEIFSKTEEVCAIIFDSIPMFTSTVVEQKTAEDYVIGVEAKKWNARFPIIYGNAARRGIALLGLTFYKINPMVTMGSNLVLVRGEWQKYMSSLTLVLRKGKAIVDNNKKVIGHKLHVKLKKSKVSSVDSKEDIVLNFYHQYGFDEVDEYVMTLIDKGKIKQGGAWCTFPSEEGEEIKLNGKEAVIKYFKESEENKKYLVRLYEED